MNKEQPFLQDDIRKEREALLEYLQDWLEAPMVVLAFLWLALFVAEVIWGLTPFLTVSGYVIWVLFVIEFALDVTLAPSKRRYLQHNWLKGLALLAPALRLFRIFRLLRLFRAAGMTRGLRLLRVLSSLNRGMRALAASMGRRGFGYVVTLTLIVVLVGAAGMYAFESEPPAAEGLDNYGDALWWTAMIMTTLGSEYWPQTAAGRALCLLLSLYAFAIFGYVTATLATFFIGRDAENEESQLPSVKAIAALHREVVALGDEIRALKG